MKIAVIGTGAMGSIYAARLSKAGHEVIAIDIWQDHIDYINRDGLLIEGPDETFVAKNIRASTKFLDLEEYTIISFLRRWCDGDISRSNLNKELIINLGYAEGNSAFQSFKDLCEIIFHHGRRSLIRHQLDCNCVGADESCFAQLILRSANNYKEDAILIALLLVPPHLTSQTVSLSEKIGTAIKQLIVSDEKNVMVN